MFNELNIQMDKPKGLTQEKQYWVQQPIQSLNQTTTCCSLLAANPEKLPRSIHPQLLWDQILGLHYFNLTLTIHRAIFCWDLGFPEFLLLDSGSKLAVREVIPNAHWRLHPPPPPSTKVYLHL